MLTVTDIEKTIAFYRDNLGFSCVNKLDGWAVKSRDAVEVMFSLPNEHVLFEKPDFSGFLYFHHNDVDALREKLKKRTEVVYPIDNFDYGMREFAILANNGYCLQFEKEIA